MARRVYSPVMRNTTCCLAALALLCLPATPSTAAPSADQLLRDYFLHETDAIARASLADIHTAADWDATKAEARRQLAEMFGLWPAPEKTDLHPTITGTLDHPQFTVEKLHFQSRPGLYVTANLYIPK